MNTASVPTFRYWGISFFWLFLGIAGVGEKQYLCTVFVKLVYCMKKVHLSSPVASRRSAVILYCMIVGLGFVSASAQAVDGVSGASTRVLAPADTSLMVQHGASTSFTAGEDACAPGHYSNTIIILYYRKII